MKRRQVLIGWLFVLPFVIVVFFFLVLPLIYAGYLSSQADSLVGGQHFVGLTNYIDTFKDPLFLEGLKRVAIYALISIPIMTTVSLISALTIDVIQTRLARIFRLIAFMPYAVPGVVAALMWGFLYSQQFGPIYWVAKRIGYPNLDMFDPNVFIYSISGIAFWAWTGYNMIVLYSALQGISREIYEAAIVDGASQKQIAFRIKIPAIRGAIVLTVLFSLIGSMQLFTEPRILSRYTNAVTLGYTPNIYAFNLAFNQSQFNYSAAVSFALGLIVLVVSYGFLLRNRRMADK